MVNSVINAFLFGSYLLDFNRKSEVKKSKKSGLKIWRNRGFV